jgi:DNA-binding MarR family transcriptional regulator
MVDVSNDILAVRAFNRFYTRLVGALDEQLLGSGFSLPEARLIYELAARGQATAAALAADLALDPGYLSRLVRTLADRDLVARTPSPSDGRETVLALTEAGRAAFAPLEQKSNDAIGALLAPLTDAARRNVIAATETITRAFAPGATIAPRHHPPPSSARRHWLGHPPSGQALRRGIRLGRNLRGAGRRNSFRLRQEFRRAA